MTMANVAAPTGSPGEIDSLEPGRWADSARIQMEQTEDPCRDTDLLPSEPMLERPRSQDIRMADVPALVLSKCGRDQAITQVFEKGVCDKIVKPVSPTNPAARVVRTHPTWLRRNLGGHTSNPKHILA